MKTKKIVSVVCLLLLGLILVLSCITLLIMSFKDYKLISGLLGSPSVGLTNITMFCQQTPLISILKNTLNINIFALVIGAFYLFIAILAINSFQKSFIKAIAALLFALPGILPVNTYIFLLHSYLPTETLVNSSVLLQVIAGAESGLRFASIFVIAALFTKGDSMPHAQKYVLLYIGMKIVHILSTDTGFMNAFANPLTYEHLDTYDALLYRSGLMQSRFSGYAAGYVVQLILQFFPALIGAYILTSLCKSEKKSGYAVPAADPGIPKAYTTDDSGNRIYFSCMILAVLPIALLYFIGRDSFQGSLLPENPHVQQLYYNGALIAATSAAVITCFGLLLAGACVQLNKFGIAWITFLFFLSDSLLGPYMIGHELGTHDTLMGVLIQNMYYILPVAIIGTKILRDNQKKNLLPALTIASLGLTFAWFWGDHMAPLVTLRSTHKYPISLGIHQILTSQSDFVAVGSASGDTQLSWMLYVLVPIIVTGVCFIVGAVLYHKKQK